MASVVKKLPVVYGALDRALGEALAQAAAAGVHPTCHAGCSNCCHFRVQCTRSEAEALVGAVAKRSAGAGLRALAERAETAFDATGPMPPPPFETCLEPYFAVRVACPMLDQASGLCTEYELRPVACRVHYVASPAADCQGDQSRAIVFRNTDSATVDAMETVAMLDAGSRKRSVAQQFKDISEHLLAALAARGVTP